jgi:hypothetical protein
LKLSRKDDRAGLAGKVERDPGLFDGRRRHRRHRDHGLLRRAPRLNQSPRRPSQHQERGLGAQLLAEVEPRLRGKTV